jgi:hypothetical protein
LAEGHIGAEDLDLLQIVGQPEEIGAIVDAACQRQREQREHRDRRRHKPTG